MSGEPLANAADVIPSPAGVQRQASRRAPLQPRLLHVDVDVLLDLDELTHSDEHPAAALVRAVFEALDNI